MGRVGYAVVDITLVVFNLIFLHKYIIVLNMHLYCWIVWLESREHLTQLHKDRVSWKETWLCWTMGQIWPQRGNPLAFLKTKSMMSITSKERVGFFWPMGKILHKTVNPLEVLNYCTDDYYSEWEEVIVFNQGAATAIKEQPLGNCVEDLLLLIK